MITTLVVACACGLLKTVVVLKLLLAPRRCIAVPVVFCRFAHEWVFRRGAPPSRGLANTIRRFRLCRRCHTSTEIGARDRSLAPCLFTGNALCCHGGP